VDVDAITVGPDLTRGVAHFLRVSAMAGKTAAQHAAELADDGNGDGYDGAAPAGDDGTAALAAMADGEADAAPGDDMFDDSAIEALAKDADSVAAPF
jgi:hypothetical protein